MGSQDAVLALCVTFISEPLDNLTPRSRVKFRGEQLKELQNAQSSLYFWLASTTLNSSLTSPSKYTFTTKRNVQNFLSLTGRFHTMGGEVMPATLSVLV